MGYVLTWEDNNDAEEGHRIYRSDSPMDPEDLPEPLAVLGPDETTYTDYTALPDVVYYYRVSAFIGSSEEVSDELPVNWTPELLFTNEEPGFWFDPSDFTTLFQDAAGTIPVTEEGQPVGLILDKSGNGHHAKQPDSALRPTLLKDERGLHYLRFNGTSQFLMTEDVDFTGTHEATVAVGVTKLADAFGVLVTHGNATTDEGAWEIAQGSALQAGSNREDYRVQISNAGRTTVRETLEHFAAPSTNVVSARLDFSIPGDGQVLVRVDGAISHGAIGSPTAPPRAGFIDGPIFLGSRLGTGAFALARVYQAFAIGERLSTEDFDRLEKFIGEQAGVF